MLMADLTRHKNIMLQSSEEKRKLLKPNKKSDAGK